MRELVALAKTGALAPGLERRWDILASTLQTLEQTETAQFFADCPGLLMPCVQRHYPLDGEQIHRHAERWDWKLLSASQTLPWSDELIERFCARWDWGWLSRNPALPWSAALIERYASRWNWAWLGKNPGLPWGSALMQRYADRLDWA